MTGSSCSAPVSAAAQVLQYQGKFDEAIVELTGCVDEARGREWTALEAFAVQNRGKVYFDPASTRARSPT